ncbi:MAG: 16S rRNA processing protein RimM [Deltaproteobacteria bacterium]|nr:16S rRNA processing protein RimM [Deltaproteobacteria bacterium]
MPSPHGQTEKLSSKSSKKNNQRHQDSLIPLGRLVNTHGIRGDVRLLPHSFPCRTLYPGLTVFLQDAQGQLFTHKVVGARPRAPFVILTLDGVDSIDRAETLRDMTVAVEETVLPPLEDGEFYYYQVIGLAVRTTAGTDIGEITQVFFSGGHDIWVVRQGEKEYLIPVIEDIVRSIDIPGKQAIIEPLAGLLD